MDRDSFGSFVSSIQTLLTSAHVPQKVVYAFVAASMLLYDIVDTIYAVMRLRRELEPHSRVIGIVAESPFKERLHIAMRDGFDIQLMDIGDVSRSGVTDDVVSVDDDDTKEFIPWNPSLDD